MGYKLKKGEKFADDKTLFHKAVWGMLVADKNNTILDFNPAWEKMFGYKKDELIGTNELIRVHPDDKEKFSVLCDKLFSRALEQFSVEMRYQKSNSSYKWVLFSCVAFFN